ncbi:glutathione S-transferase family protein [Hyphomonas johnsonii]|uniref:Glutathione S-transferase domain-containing protein n=1 Tax=Hyphomonas johnsonii MHS-2 TaxID=1280950 RepID=A0A059FE82_9PROT|nr:glutathione S-transferase family protein [Hyphomonas johnsonii]KCZ88856.1 glutathione S-transferase domain-containing protein [Hyphomonas johnsonii MHS-2]
MADYHLYSADISPFAQRVVMQLEFKQIPFTESVPPGGLKSEAFAAISRIGKIPVLQVGSVHLPESEVISEFLEQTHPDPSLLPDDPMERANCRLIARIADLYIMEAMVPLFANLSRATRNQEHVDRALSVLDRGLGYLEPWINPAVHAVGGRLTLADLAVAPILRYAAEYPPIFGMTTPFGERPNVSSYYDRCREHALIDSGLSRIEAGWQALRRKPQ